MNDQFNAVVVNAFDFLDRSVDELKNKRPKYSVIHFYSAVELFLKARLLKEHWAQIVKKPEQADRGKFLKGDFQSVGLEEAAARLDKVVGESLVKEALDCFNKLRNHRNQMVHFAHSAQHDDAKAKKEMERIVIEQAKGWHYLKNLLCERWKEHFQDHQGTVRRLDRIMREQADYLKAKFETIQDEMRQRKLGGHVFADCPVCHFSSFEYRALVWSIGEPVWIGSGKCLTCDFSPTFISITCVNEDCGKPIWLTYGHEVCKECSHDYSPSEIEEVLGQHDKLKQTDYYDPGDFSNAGCGSCDGYETVVPLENDEWFCTDCFDIEEHVGQCEWCTGYSTHIPEHSYLSGCTQCEGRVGHEKDD